MSVDKINIEVSVKEIYDILVTALHPSPNKHITANVIISHLQDQNGYGLEQFYKAHLLGIKPECPVLCGEEGLVKINHVYRSEMNVKMMKEKGMILQGERIKVELESVDLSKRDALRVKYNYLNHTGELVSRSWPIDLYEIEPLEDVLPELKEELPF